jgi:hypothetical protein
MFPRISWQNMLKRRKRSKKKNRFKHLKLFKEKVVLNLWDLMMKMSMMREIDHSVLSWI